MAEQTEMTPPTRLLSGWPRLGQTRLGCYVTIMNAFEKVASAGFTPIERVYIRGQLDRFFSTLPTVAEGFQLKIWRGGPHAKEPKLPPAAKSLIERGLMRLDATSPLPRLFFTEPGLITLR